MYFFGGKVRLGQCERLDDESVVTEFRATWPLLFPMTSHYRRGRDGRTLFETRTPRASVLLAYARWVVLPFLFLNGIASYEIAHGAFALELIVASGCAWLWVMLVAGRVRGGEVRRRRVIASAVGHAAPPKLLLFETLVSTVERLEAEWANENRRPWSELTPGDVKIADLPLYYALCRYVAARNVDELIEVKSRNVWIEIEENWTEIAARLANRPRSAVTQLGDRRGSGRRRANRFRRA